VGPKGKRKKKSAEFRILFRDPETPRKLARPPKTGKITSEGGRTPSKDMFCAEFRIFFRDPETPHKLARPPKTGKITSEGGRTPSKGLFCAEFRIFFRDPETPRKLARLRKTGEITSEGKRHLQRTCFFHCLFAPILQKPFKVVADVDVVDDA
jgi:hypothetical protein